MKLLRTLAVPLLPIHFRKTILPSLFEVPHSWLVLLYLSPWIKGNNVVITGNDVALENQFVLKQHSRYCCLCSFLKTTYLILGALLLKPLHHVHETHECWLLVAVSLRLILCFKDDDQKCKSQLQYAETCEWKFIFWL